MSIHKENYSDKCVCTSNRASKHIKSLIEWKGIANLKLGISTLLSQKSLDLVDRK